MMKSLLLIGLCAGVAHADAIDDLPKTLAGAKSAAELRPLLKGLTVDEQPVSDGTTAFYIKLAPRDAKAFVAAWKLARPYAISGDVHQHTWQVMVWDQDVPDPNGKRIHAKTIHAGRWIVRPHLVGRPEGALPKVSAGASPAYDLATYAAKIDGIEIMEPGANRD